MIKLLSFRGLRGKGHRKNISETTSNLPKTIILYQIQDYLIMNTHCFVNIKQNQIYSYQMYNMLANFTHKFFWFNYDDQFERLHEIFAFYKLHY